MIFPQPDAHSAARPSASADSNPAPRDPSLTVAGGTPPVLRLADLAFGDIGALLARFGLELAAVPDGAPIPGSYWGAPESGIVYRFDERV
ncbi:MAG: hypothetical protein HYV18_01595 [Gammaproteobacteria bacterium]|nr:hypothetical protein [Gammaproteobacteria bacterium]